MLQRYSPLLLLLAVLACSRPDDARIGASGQPAGNAPIARKTPADAPIEQPALVPVQAPAAAASTAAVPQVADSPALSEENQLAAAAPSRFARRANSFAAASEAPASGNAGDATTIADNVRRPDKNRVAASRGRRNAAATQSVIEQPTAAPVAAAETAPQAAPDELSATLAAAVAAPGSAAAGEQEPETGWGSVPGPPAQVFRLRAALDTTVRGARGTLLALPANAFAYEDDPKQQPVTGEVVVRLREFYTVGDMILQQLHTASGEQLLETGGMVLLTARTPDGHLCRLRPGASVLVRMPAPQPTAGMQIFAGVPTAAGRIDWRAPRAAIRPNQLRPGAPVFRSRVPLAAFLQKRLLCSETTLRRLRRSPQRLRHVRAWNGGRTVRIVARWKAVIQLDSAGRATGVQQAGAPADELSTAVQQAVAQLPLFTPAYLQAPATKQPRQAGRSLRVKPARLRARGVVPVWLALTRQGRILVKAEKGRAVYPVALNSRNEPISREELSKLNAKEIATLETQQLGGYLFAASQLGWINCDRFQKSSQPQVLFTVRDAQPADAVSLVFHNFRAVMSGTPSTRGHQFQRLPQGEPVTVVALRRQGAELYMAMTKTTVGSTPLTGLNFQLVTPGQLQAALFQLDRIGTAQAGSLSRR
jgi:hypothetical protein